MAEGKNRHIYIDILRIVACILVILVHVSAMDWDAYGVTSLEWKTMNVVNCLGMGGVAIFLMISGALFLQPGRELTVKYVWKKILWLFVIYVFWLCFYNGMPLLTGELPWDYQTIRYTVIDNILYGGGVYHLWYLPALIAIYMLVPLMKPALASKQNCEYFLVLFAVFGATIPLLLRFQNPLTPYLLSFQNRFGVYFITCYMGYFVLGHYLHQFAPRLKGKKLLYTGLATIAMMLVIILCCYLDAVGKNEPSSCASTPASITCVLFVSGVWVVIQSLAEGITKERTIKWLQPVADLTLGVYLLHPYLIDVLFPWISLEQLLGNYVAVMLARILFVTGVAGLIVWVLRKIPGLKKLL